MANTAINVSGNISLPDGSTMLLSPPQITNSTPVGTVTEPLLSSTPTTIPVPAGAVGFSVQPPAGNLIAITIKGVTGDTGLRLHNTIGIPAMGLDPSVTSIVLVAASIMAAVTVVKFW